MNDGGDGSDNVEFCSLESLARFFSDPAGWALTLHRL